VSSTLAITIDDLPDHGVTLVSPQDSQFDALARPLIGERVADVVLQMKPMLTIAANDSDKTIVSFSVVWETTRSDGRTSRHWGHTSFPKAVCGDLTPGGDDEPFATRTRRMHATDVVIHGWAAGDAYYDQFLSQFVDRAQHAVAKATTLRIALDAVIFDDGTLIGPDRQRALQDLFGGLVSAKQARYRALLDALDEGRPAEEALRHSDKVLFMRDDWREFESQEALGEARLWAKHHAGENLAALIRSTLRLEPFEIRRIA
jgi:hypothetical protein